MNFWARDRENDESNGLRQEMVNRLKNLGLVCSGPVEEALRLVPRHLFVPQVDVKTAYNDQAVVTRWQDGEAISSASAPSIVALMLELLDLHPGQRVLEIGAGTGYNAALMARLVGESGSVVTIDIDDEIVQGAREHLEAVGIKNARVMCGDGALGWAEGAPYDRVILTAAVADLLPAWHEQLVRGGRLVGPLELLRSHARFTELPVMPDQFLVAFEWTGDHFERLALLPCIFMPLRGDYSAVVREVGVHKVEGELSADLPRDIEAQDIFALLRGSMEDEPTEVHLAFQEMFGLRLWLALREAHFCEIYVPERLNTGAIPAHLHRARDFATAIGLCEADTCCLLKLEEEVEGQPVDAKRPFRLVLRSFGKDHELISNLREQVEIWDRAGHPFVWSIDGFSAQMPDMHIQAFPHGGSASFIVRDYETLLNRQYTRFLFTPQTAVPARVEKSIVGQEEPEQSHNA